METISIDKIAFLSLINDKQRQKSLGLYSILKDYIDGDSIQSLEAFRDVVQANNVQISLNLEDQITQNLEVYEDEIQKLQRNKVDIIPFFSEKYPKTLYKVKNPPILLYKKGNLDDFQNCIAIVGTRNLTYFGHKMARIISQSLAEAGFTIVSGLARGVDTEAHLGALDAGGKTIAILPSGISDIYPKENEKLVVDIVEKGAILSEVSTLEHIQKVRFVERNRITSGLSKCVIVIESNDDGGTVQQAKIARDQGKRILILKPSNKDTDALNGYKKMLSLGAESFDTLEALLDDIEKLDDADSLSRKTTKLMNLSHFE